jgi:hypothetical protein
MPEAYFWTCASGLRFPREQVDDLVAGGKGFAPIRVVIGGSCRSGSLFEQEEQDSRQGGLQVCEARRIVSGCNYGRARGTPPIGYGNWRRPGTCDYCGEACVFENFRLRSGQNSLRTFNAVSTAS